MRVFHGLSELASAVGTHLGYSDWHTVTQEQIARFAEATGDHQWIHVDPAKAAAGPFGTTVAHGFLTLSMVPMLAGEVYTVRGLSMGVNYGTNKVRFPTPVPAGSRVRAGVELVSLVPGTIGSQAVIRVTVELEGSDKPACVAETVAVLVP
ncbi:MaoC family dehydratase [Nocardia gamkensis]|uniref:MaoC family dehydratase n=1 Tax=Nocardia gamkensis TaxID=352869 RepID=A0A7X6KZX1_9NOCA|nr:MaoC family dehydratase [Nocardia gamkensis]NKY25266.1 MaoC family dehydratase [Nocardia gamkensis]NQE70262.1 putative enoyl-CoA hydratase 1 [Nocardia gamkensis]